MKGKILWLIVSCLMILSLVLASCAPAETPTTPTIPTTPTTPTTPTIPTTPTTPTIPTTPAGPDMVKLSLKKLDGTVVEKMVEKPRYGGIITTAYHYDTASFDPNDWQTATGTVIVPFLYEKLQIGDYTRSPNGTNEWPFTHFMDIPMQMRTGCLMESWEQADPLTVILHIRKGIHFQNIPPVNGRELTAADVAYSFLRQKSSPRASLMYFGNVESIVTTDKYTAVVKLKRPDYPWMAVLGINQRCPVYPREMVEKYGDLTKPESACGTGPWMLEDYIRGSVIAFKRNPDYWMKDPFFPENTLPYADKAKVLIIPDISTRISALRTGKIDVLIHHFSGIAAWQDAESLKKTNPEINQRPFIDAGGLISIMFRVDKAPFNDIRVRQALILAVDQNAICNDYLRGYGEVHNYPVMREQGEDLWTPIEKLPAEPTIPGSACGAREMFSYNPTRAKQLLADAGYPQGFKTDILITPDQVDVTSMVAAYWKDIGVDLALHVKDMAVKMSQITAIPRVYPEAMTVQTVNANHPVVVWPSEFVTRGAMNAGNINDSRIDQTYVDMCAEPDEAKRNKMTKDLAVYALEQAYKLVGPHQEVYNFWQPWLKNCEGGCRVHHWGGFSGLAFFWVNQDLKEKMTGRR